MFRLVVTRGDADNDDTDGIDCVDDDGGDDDRQMMR